MKLGSHRKGAKAALRSRVAARVEHLELRALLSAGDPDTTWKPTGVVLTDVGTEAASQNDVAVGVAVQANGRIVTAGTSIGPDGFQRWSLTRHFANGDLDAGFGDNGRVITDFAAENNAVAHAIAIDNDQNIVVAGTSFGGDGDALTVARYLPSGGLDPSFGSGGSGKSVIALAGQFASDIDIVITDGGLINIGYTRSQGTEADLAVARLNESGFLSGSVSITDSADFEQSIGLAIDADGNVVQAGVSFFGTETLVGQLVTARFLPNGGIDGSYGNSGKLVSDVVLDGGRSVMIDHDGSLIAAGFANGLHPVSGSPTSLLKLARVAADGSLATSVTTGLSNDSQNWSMAAQRDGKILIAGDDFSFDTSAQHYMLARFNSAFALDSGFGDADGVVDGVYHSPIENSVAAAVVSDSEGQILLAGFAPGAADADFLLARHNSGIEPGAAELLADANARPDNAAYVVVEGASLQLDGSGSLTTGGDGGFEFVQNQRRIDPATGGGGSGEVTYAWDLDADGEFDDSNVADPILNAGALDGPRTVTVSLKVSDASNANSFVVDSAQVQVNNVAPTASINLPGGSSLEGDEVTLTANVNDGFPNDGFTYEWTATDGTNSFGGSGPTLTFTPPDNAQYTITLRVRDDDGGQVDATPVNLNVQNAAPTAEITGGAASVDEGTPVAFSADTNDVDEDTLSYNWTVKKDGVPYASGTNATFGFTPDDNAAYEVKLTVSDEDGGTSVEQTTVVNAANVTPTPDVADTVGVRGEQHTLLLAATDPSSADTTVGFSYTVDWGDGSGVETFAAGTTEAHHTYLLNGTYSVDVTATDQDEATSEPVTISMTTQTAAVQNGILTVSGNGGHDKIRIFPSGGGISVGVSDVGTGANEFVQTYTGVTRIVVNGHAGDDQIDAIAVSIPVEMYGGQGHDKLQSGSGGDVLVGGDGDDKIAGNGGRDVLIGGQGADKISGSSDDDILIGGFTAHDGNITALRAISAEWRSTARDYVQRAGNINGSAPMASRLNGTFYFTASGPNTTTWDDLTVDTLAGEAGSDWFFANVDSTGKDKITDASSSEFIFDVVPVL